MISPPNSLAALQKGFQVLLALKPQVTSVDEDRQRYRIGFAGSTALTEARGRQAVEEEDEKRKRASRICFWRVLLLFLLNALLTTLL